LLGFFSEKLYLVAQMINGIGFCSIFFHYEKISKDRPRPLFMGLILMLYSAVVVFSFISIISLDAYGSITFDLLSVEITPDFISNHLVLAVSYFGGFYSLSFLIIVIFFRALYVDAKIHMLSKSTPTLIDTFAVALLLAYRVIYLPRLFISSEVWNLISTVALMLSIIGIFMMIGNYIAHPGYVFFLPFPIHNFMLYNSAGILCYSRKVAQIEPEMEQRDLLISGAFTAISALIQETLGSDADIRHINAKVYQIYFNKLPGDSGTLVAISYGNIKLLSDSLKRFVRLLPNDLNEEINKIGIDMAGLEIKIDDLIQKAFPYVQFAKKD